jgi:hypothetical protein
VTDDDTPGRVEFVIKVYDQGKMTQVMDKMAVGDTMLMKGPRGRFQYTRNMKKAIGELQQQCVQTAALCSSLMCSCQLVWQQQYVCCIPVLLPDLPSSSMVGPLQQESRLLRPASHQLTAVCGPSQQCLAPVVTQCSVSYGHPYGCVDSDMNPLISCPMLLLVPLLQA